MNAALAQVRTLRAELARLSLRDLPQALKYGRGPHVAALGTQLSRICGQLEGVAATLAGLSPAPALPTPQPVAGPEPPLRFARRSAPGRWVTIGAREGADGKKHGGSPVYIEGGRITKGHPSLTGRQIDALKEEPVAVSGQQERNWARGYQRALWGKKAKAAGIPAQDLHQLASEMMAHDRELVHDRTRMLQRAHKMSENMGYGSLQGLNQKIARGADSESIRGLDDMAELLIGEHPEQFAGHGDKEQRLFDLLAEGNPRPMSEEAAYREAFDHLAGDYAPSARAEELEPVPFGRRGE
jgi:hypothetical protein